MVSSALSLLTELRISAGRGGKLNADAGFAQIDGPEPEEDRDGGDDFEEDDGAQSQPADLPQVGMPGDADHQRSEQQRRNDGLDQPQKDERQHAQMRGDIGEVVPDLRAQQHGDEDPRGERPPQASVDDQRGERNPAQSGKDYRCRWPAETRANQGRDRGNGGDQERNVLAAMAVG